MKIPLLTQAIKAIMARTMYSAKKVNESTIHATTNMYKPDTIEETSRKSSTIIPSSNNDDLKCTDRHGLATPCSRIATTNNKYSIMKKMLIALDYDSSAQKIAEAGYALAKLTGAEVTLLHVIADRTYYASIEYSQVIGYMGFSDKDMASMFDNGLEKAMKHYLVKSKHHLGDTNIKTLVEEGDFADTILSVAKEIQADFIVIGSHSRNWLANVVMGSVTEKVLRHTTIPLIIIPIKKQVEASL